MHHSMLSNIIIDCNDLDRVVEFWSKALGLKILATKEPYVVLEKLPTGMYLCFQRVPEPKIGKSRMHLDLMSDNIEAEVQRLETLGAQRREQIDEFWVMEDPVGNEFCVLPVMRRDFPELAQTWE